jgi:hypothetical protein
VALASLMKSQPLHVGLGSGDGAWNVPPLEAGSESGLLTAIGWRKATEVSYVVASVSGEIVTPTGATYARTMTPTRNLYIRTDFDYEDATGSTIRESGIFVGLVPLPSLPPSQRYFAANQVVDPGVLVSLSNREPFFRFPNTRERFETVITF